MRQEGSDVDKDIAKSYKLRFLASTDSWERVKKVFLDDLGITKDKKDDSVVPIRDHFVVELEFNDTDLTDSFYDKVTNSKFITILSDEYSRKKAQEILQSTASVELRLRELAIYAYDLAATYKEIMNTKHRDAKHLVSNHQLVGENVTDPLVSFLDFGELIDFMGRTGNQVDESNLADDTARLIEASATFDEFKKKYAQKFKKLTVWEIISDAVLVSKIEWAVIKKDLEDLKEIRNTALHHRVLTPSKTIKSKLISNKLMGYFKTRTPRKDGIKTMDAVFESWNNALIGYNAQQKVLEKLVTVDSSAFQKIIDRQFDSQKIVQRALENIAKFPNIQTTAFESLSRSLSSIEKLGLSSWVIGGVDNNGSKKIEDETNRQDGKDKYKDDQKGMVEGVKK